jgi:hypothetical protein
VVADWETMEVAHMWSPVSPEQELRLYLGSSSLVSAVSSFLDVATIASLRQNWTGAHRGCLFCL